MILLGGIGYFFIEFEDIEEEGFATESAEEEVDPYAWGKKDVVEIPEQQPAAVPIQSVQPQASHSIPAGFGIRNPINGFQIQTIRPPNQ